METLSYLMGLLVVGAAALFGINLVVGLAKRVLRDDPPARPPVIWPDRAWSDTVPVFPPIDGGRV